MYKHIDNHYYDTFHWTRKNHRNFDCVNEFLKQHKGKDIIISILDDDLDYTEMLITTNINFESLSELEQDKILGYIYLDEQRATLGKYYKEIFKDDCVTIELLKKWFKENDSEDDVLKYLPTKFVTLDFCKFLIEELNFSHKFLSFIKDYRVKNKILKYFQLKNI